MILKTFKRQLFSSFLKKTARKIRAVKIIAKQNTMAKQFYLG